MMRARASALIYWSKLHIVLYGPFTDQLLFVLGFTDLGLRCACPRFDRNERHRVLYGPAGRTSCKHEDDGHRKCGVRPFCGALRIPVIGGVVATGTRIPTDYQRKWWSDRGSGTDEKGRSLMIMFCWKVTTCSDVSLDYVSVSKKNNCFGLPFYCLQRSVNYTLLWWSH